MPEEVPFAGPLPPAAEPAVWIVRHLVDAGHEAVLAGGCVRDLLLGLEPEDFDVATDAPPDRVGALFPATRLVGAQFGVVLVKRQRRWVEVATFRSDGPYLDGRRPSRVTMTDARHDALRRDFTVNGMFLDPLGMRVRDYVGGQADLAARLIRAIGDPSARFSEDYLRLLRAVRFAARLVFPIEPATHAAIRAHAPQLARVAAERVLQELEKMWSQPTRRAAWRLLRECDLLPYLWPGAGWDADAWARADQLLDRLPGDAPFELVMAILLADRSRADVVQIGRALTMSNDQTETTAWLVAHQADLDQPAAPRLAALKRLMAHRAFAALRMWAEARYVAHDDGAVRRVALAQRVAEVPPAAVQPVPLVNGDDLKDRGIEPGPVYAQVLGELYTRQLDEELTDRAAALHALDAWLARRGLGPTGP